jgi:hypothetical protein
MQRILDLLGSFPAGLATGIIVALLGLAAKYLIDYRLQSRRLKFDEKRYGSEDERGRWRLQAEARQEVYAVVGSTQSNFVRAAMELRDRLNTFLENPDNTGSTTLNRAHAARAASNSHFGRRPRRFGIRAGTTTKLISSSNVQQ